jgi:hypothetical protein
MAVAVGQAVPQVVVDFLGDAAKIKLLAVLQNLFSSSLTLG